MTTPLTPKDSQQIALEAAGKRDIELEALPCPFCGSDEIQLNPIADGSWTLDCHTCGAGSGTNEKEFVLRAWNKRTSLTQVLKDRGLDADKVESKIRAMIASAQPQPSKARKEQAPRAQGSPASYNPDLADVMLTEGDYEGLADEVSKPNPPRGQQQEWTLISDGDDDQFAIIRETRSKRTVAVNLPTIAGKLIIAAHNAALDAERQRREQAEQEADKNLDVADSILKASEQVERELRQQLLSALAAIEKLTREHGLPYPSAKELGWALEDHDAEVREPLMDGLNRLMALVNANCLPQAKRAYDVALAKVKEQ